ncbi:MAG: hypothetical protein ACOC0H_00210 [Thermodesulfobacteriota bacterium]
MKFRIFFITTMVLFLYYGMALAVPTTVVVRVKSSDGKFVGTSMGGALVTIQEVLTGKLLAEGVTTGDTGDTEKIMKEPRKQGDPISDDDSARFTAILNIDTPTYVEIKAYGPQAQRQSANTVSQTLWLIPGKNLDQGDALMMELHGLVVDVIQPPTHIKVKGAPQTFKIKANITLMCGCGITPGGLWAPEDYEIKALIKKNGRSEGTLDLQYAGETSLFEGEFTAREPGTYEAVVYAVDGSAGNTGLDAVTFIVEPEKKAP